MDRKWLWLWIGLLTILALVGCGSEANAYPALLGMSGGGQTPSPQVVPAGQYDLAVDYARLQSGSTDIDGWLVRLVGGASERAELGIAYSSLSPDKGESGRLTDIGAKVLIGAGAGADYDLAIGANYSDLGGGLDTMLGLDNVIRVYGVLGKDLTPQPDIYGEAPGTRTYGYAGLMHTRYDNTGSETSTRPFAGVEFTGQGGGSLVLEWKNEEYGDDVTSAILRYAFNPTLMGQLGITNNLGGFGDALGDDHRVSLGLNYRFGQPEEEAWEW